jgi:hypothetical protein
VNSARRILTRRLTYSFDPCLVGLRAPLVARVAMWNSLAAPPARRNGNPPPDRHVFDRGPINKMTYSRKRNLFKLHRFRMISLFELLRH